MSNMFSHEQLTKKGLVLNEYPEGKFYELVINNPSMELLDACGHNYDGCCMPDKMIIQTRENLTEKKLMIECYLWDLSDDDFNSLLEVL